jgi:hypothetical protein
MTGADTKIVVTKLDAARRQLRTAIHLWFNDGDPVSIHALAFAAYELSTLSARNVIETAVIFCSIRTL